MALEVEILGAYYDDYCEKHGRQVVANEYYFDNEIVDMLPSYYEELYGPYEDDPEYKNFMDFLTLRRKCFNEFLNGQMGYELRNDGHSVVAVRKVFDMDILGQQFNVFDIYKEYKKCFAIIDLILHRLKNGFATVCVMERVNGKFLRWAKETELEGKVRIVVLKEELYTSETCIGEFFCVQWDSPADRESGSDQFTYIDELENSDKFTPEHEKEAYEEYKSEITPKDEVVQKYPTVVEIRRVYYEGLKLLTPTFVKYPTIDEMYDQMYEEFSGQLSMIGESLVLVYDIPSMPERFVYKNRQYLFRCFYYNGCKIYEMPTDLALEKFHELYEEMIKEQNEDSELQSGDEESSDNNEQADQ